MTALVLDSEALSQLVSGGRRERMVRAALAAARNLGVPVVVPAAVLAELYRGGRRDQALDAYLSRSAPIGIVDTDRGLARRVGNILARVHRGSADHVDACVVAACLRAGGGVVLTGDPNDLSLLSGDYPGVAIENVGD